MIFYILIVLTFLCAFHLVLMPADQFAALFGTGEVNIHVQVPAAGGDASAPAAWNLQGQTVTVNLPVTSTVKQLKEALSAQLGGMPANKQQLKAAAPGLGKRRHTLCVLIWLLLIL
jgi:hypothetical protein